MSPELRVEVTFLMTFSSVNPVKIGDGHNMEAVEQAGEAGHPGYTAGYRGTEWVIGMIQIPARSMVIPVLLRYACLSL